MTLLPIVERELRVAARQPSTFLLRFLTALIATVFWLALFGSRSPMTTPEDIGQTFFNAASIVLFIGCAFSGIFLTADTISSEKRDGTLGLLFLTDLRGHDVVLGKLTSSSVRAAYALVAVFPVLALPLLLGGVTVGEFWRVVLMLLMTLYLSLAIGLAASAFTRQSRTSMGGTFLCMLFVTAILPLLHYVIEDHVTLAFLRLVLQWPSPGYTLACAIDDPPDLGNYWGSVMTVAAMGTILLILASLALPRAWQERARDAQRIRESPRTLLRDWSNPVAWLAVRQQPTPALVWGVLGAIVAISVGFAAHSFLSSGTGRWMRSSFLLAFVAAFATHQLVKYMIAAEASRRFSEDRSSGAMELLFVTPLTSRQIINGQRDALWRLAFGPVFLCAGLNAFLFVFFVAKMPFFGPAAHAWQLGVIGGIVLLAADYYALSWLGMWQGLTQRRHHRALLNTLARVMLPPWIATFVIVTTLGVRGMRVEEVLACWFVVSMIASIMSGRFAQARLQGDLRKMVQASPEFRERPWHSPVERMTKQRAVAHEAA